MSGPLERATTALTEVADMDTEHQIRCHADTLPDAFRRVMRAVTSADQALREARAAAKRCPECECATSFPTQHEERCSRAPRPRHVVGCPRDGDLRDGPCGDCDSVEVFEGTHG